MSEYRPIGFPRETLLGVNTPCQAFSGICAAVETFNGLPVVIMAENPASLVLALKEINPKLKDIDTSLFVPASLIHDSVVRRQSPLVPSGSIYKDDHEI